MPDPNSFYAPPAHKIKTIIVVEDNGACQTYPDLPSAVAAVYNLSLRNIAVLLELLKQGISQ